MTRAGGVRLPLFPSVTLDCCQYVRAPVGSERMGTADTLTAKPSPASC